MSPAFDEKPNILVIITDQERAAMHWPEGWAEANLPSLRRLKEHGVSFRNAITNTCQCSPSRATLHTGTYPPEHGVTTTFGPGPGMRPQTLRSSQNNLARTLAAAGYHVAYKGKWHLTRPVNRPGIRPGTWTEHDIAVLKERFGYGEWNPPDAGNSLGSLKTLGAGKAQHDRRYLTGTTTKSGVPGLGESAIEFLKHHDRREPFCLFVSLVNPHDIFVYPAKYRKAGFRSKDFGSLPIDLPETYDEDLANKPMIHQLLHYYFERIDPIKDDRQARNYARFYAWLHTIVDKEIGTLLDALDHLDLTGNTLIVRISDHGEMGMAHGGLRQKEYNCYEETLRVPMIFSHPGWFTRPVESTALAGLVDILPTLAAVAGVPQEMRAGFRGADLTTVLRDPQSPGQDSVHFTYDDDFLPDSGVPGFIRAIRTRQWKYAVYFDPIHATFEYEMYNLINDPLETRNLAHAAIAADHATDMKQLHRDLLASMRRNHTVPESVEWPVTPDIGM